MAAYEDCDGMYVIECTITMGDYFGIDAVMIAVANVYYVDRDMIWTRSHGCHMGSCFVLRAFMRSVTPTQMYASLIPSSLVSH